MARKQQQLQQQLQQESLHYPQHNYQEDVRGTSSQLPSQQQPTISSSYPHLQNQFDTTDLEPTLYHQYYQQRGPPTTHANNYYATHYHQSHRGANADSALGKGHMREPPPLPPSPPTHHADNVTSFDRAREEVSPLSRSSSLAMLDRDTSIQNMMTMMMNTTPHSKTTRNHNFHHQHDLHHSSRSFLDVCPLPFHESSEFDGHTLSFLTSISTSAANASTDSTIDHNALRSNYSSGSTVQNLSLLTATNPTTTQEKNNSNNHSHKRKWDGETEQDQPGNQNANAEQQHENRHRLLRSTSSQNRQRSNSKMTTDIAASLLHNACKLFPRSLAVVESAVQFDPDAIWTPIPTLCTSTLPRSHDVGGSKIPSMTATTETRIYYSYPLNIALQYNASLDVVAFLLQQYPDVLTKTDGPNQTGSLSIALSSCDRHNNSGEDASVTLKDGDSVGNNGSTRGTRIEQLIRMFVSTNPECVKVIDRRSNTALHYLAKRPNGDVSCDAISLVYQYYPAALNVRNCLGLTPVQVAQRNPTVTDELLDHWYTYSYREPEMQLEQSLVQIDHELDESRQKTGPIDFGPAHDTPLGRCGGTVGCGGGDTVGCGGGPTTQPIATKAANASAYFVPSVISSNTKDYETRGLEEMLSNPSVRSIHNWRSSFSNNL